MNRFLLDHAHRMIEGREGPTGAWPRAAAFLTRQALEGALDGLWSATLPAMQGASRSTQLACLVRVLDDHALIADVRAAWSSLSRACHYHHYEIAPTAAELQRWIRQTERLIQALERTRAT